jgi:pimeloyl-ACP methyl ester carboxylesterase
MEEIMGAINIPRLDPAEQHFRIDSPNAGLNLFLRYLPPISGDAGVVLYVHGATFPSALSVAHRFDGKSWRDSLTEAGFHVWAVDFLGFGYSDAYPEMTAPAEAARPLGRAQYAAGQVEAALRFISEHHNGCRISLIAHSWGSMAAGLAAGQYPDLVERIVFFAPIALRPRVSGAPLLPAWKTVTLEDQWTRFTADTPKDEAPVMLERHFVEWGEHYLDSDPDSRARMPPAVKVPLGPTQEIAEAWSERLAYEPARIVAPVAIIRGAWDSLCTDLDAAWLFDALKSAPTKRDVKLSRGGHLMHLEEGRSKLHRTALDFLLGGDLI